MLALFLFWSQLFSRSDAGAETLRIHRARAALRALSSQPGDPRALRSTGVLHCRWQHTDSAVLGSSHLLLGVEGRGRILLLGAGHGCTVCMPPEPQAPAGHLMCIHPMSPAVPVGHSLGLPGPDCPRAVPGTLLRNSRLSEKSKPQQSQGHASRRDCGSIMLLQVFTTPAGIVVFIRSTRVCTRACERERVSGPPLYSQFCRSQLHRGNNFNPAGA